MPPAVRIGDPNEAGGLAMSPGARSVLINGRPACITGTSVSPHLPCPVMKIHCRAKTTLGSRSVTAEGKPIVYVGSLDTCFDPRVLGSLNVIVGN
jgi:uncharacterized Zn-binding protein involved in type VI secretion